MSAGSSLTIQALSTAIGAGIAFLLYESYTKSNLGKSKTSGPQGLDPNWKGGAPIYPDHPINVPQTGCQQWNTEQNLFEHVGPSALDVDSTQCFLGTGSNQLVRFTDNTGTTWKSANPIEEDPALHGTCYFFDGKELYSFPDIGGQNLPSGGIYPQGGFESNTPPNRSARLCFNSGSSQATTGLMFTSDEGANYLNPQINYVSEFQLARPQNWGTFSYPDGQTTQSFDLGYSASTPQCQQYKSLTDITGKINLNAWGNAGPGTVSFNQKDCLADSTKRYWDPQKQLIIYVASDGSLIQTPMLPES